MANLLDQASILLTPTAYDNGKVLCVKPSTAPYGDFDFSRNSSATRVNAQGLVEDVQILSGNLVTNGDFSQEGAELLTQPVNLVTDFNTNSGGVIVDADTFTTSGGSLDGISKQFLTVGKYYKLVIEGDTTSSGFSIGSLGNSGNEYGSGFGTHYFECINIGLWIRQNTSGTTNITSFSVKEVGQDWVLSGETEITAQGGRVYSSAGGVSSLDQSSVMIIGNQYKLTFDVIATNGTKLANPNSTNIYDTSTIGSKVFYITAQYETLYFKRFGGITDVTITNISLIEITNDTNLPRINYDGFSYDGSGAIIPNSGCGSWLFEPQSTNLVTYSEAFNNAYWTKSGASVVSGFVSPSGDTNAFKLVEDNGSSGHILFKNNINTGSGKSTISIKAKADSRNWIFIYDTEQVEGCFFDLSNGTVGTVIGSPDAYSITALSNGWYDINLTTTSTTRVDFQVYLAIADNNFNYQGDGASGLYIWGAQLEFLSYATSYIPTEGTTVTRNRDLCTNGGSAALINSTEGTLYAEIAALSDDGTNRRISLSDGTNTNRLILTFSTTTNQITYIVVVNGTTQASGSYNTTDTTQFFKLAVKYKENDCALWANGVQINTDTSGTTFPINTLNVLQFADGSGTSNLFYGKTKCLAVFPYLNDTELAELTTI